MIRRLFAVLLSLALLPVRGHAAFEDTGAGARPAGFGGAFTAVADDAHAVYFNPAGLGALLRPHFTAAHSVLFTGLDDDSRLGENFVAFAYPLGGRKGTAGLGWKSFALSGGLYREDAFLLSYGRRVWGEPEENEVHLGFTGKMLSRKFGSFAGASDAFNNLQRTGQADPLLTGANSKSAVDGDLGLLWRVGDNYAFALAAANVMQADVAFGGGDKNKMLTRAAFNYRGLLSNYTAEVATGEGPDGKRDNRLIAGAERWLPLKLAGEVGARGSLGIGSREYKRVTAGLSYRNKRFQVDYAFTLPLGLLSGTASHTVGFGMRFGSPTERDESMEALLFAMRELGAGRSSDVPGAGAGPSDPEARKLVGRARRLARKALFKEAQAVFSQALTKAAADEELLKEFGLLNLIARHYPALQGYHSDPVESLVYRGSQNLLRGRAEESLTNLSKAMELAPTDSNLADFVKQVEKVSGLKRPQVAAPEVALEAKLAEASAAIDAGDFATGIRLSREVLDAQPSRKQAWQNLGTAYFATESLEKSLFAWRKAYDLETDPGVKDAIGRYIGRIRRMLAQRDSSPRSERGKRRALGPAEQARVRALYVEGLEAYTDGELTRAEKTFKEILEIDPSNVQARNALRRISKESAR